jgi:hypothetical protein
MIDTDTLLAPVRMARSETDALKEVVKANTEAFKQILIEMAKVDNPDKLKVVIADVEKAMQDLSMKSQKVDAALRDASAADPSIYGQYPIHQPLNPDNPVPWPPDYVPPSDGNGSKEAKK